MVKEEIWEGYITLKIAERCWGSLCTTLFVRYDIYMLIPIAPLRHH